MDGWLDLADAALLASIVMYAVAAAVFAGVQVLERAAAPAAEATARVALAATGAGLTAHAVALLGTTISVRRVPLASMSEFAIVSAFAAVVAFLGVGARTGTTRRLGSVALLPVVVTLVLAVTVIYARPGPVPPALQSAWMGIHVTAAAAAVGAVTVGMLGCAVQVMRGGDADDPGWDRADRVARTAYACAFPVWTVAVATGAMWAGEAWGRPWGWDPKEVWAFITWVVLACYLHARHTAGVRRLTVAFIGLAGYGVLLFNFVAVNLWFNGLHSYAGI